jgi:hypothetical protein
MAYMHNKKGTDTVREITGLETERCKLIRSAALTGDWSKIATDELRVPVFAQEEEHLEAKLCFGKGAKAKLKRKFITAILIERSKRKADDSVREMMVEVEKNLEKDDPETFKEMRKLGLI